MNRTFHLITGEYPPQVGGVGDYTAKLASALARRGCDVHVWSQAATDGGPVGGVTLHALPDVFGARSRASLEAAFDALPGRVIVQYVPNAFGRRGANLPFCRWLARIRRGGADLRVMFHEPYLYFTPARPLRNLLAVAQRVMAALLLRGGGVAYLSTDSWIEYLRPYASARTSWTVLPIPSTVDIEPPPAAIERWRRSAGGSPVVGHFGTYGDHVATVLEPVVVALLDSDPAVRVLLLGRNGDDFAARLVRTRPGVADRLHASGALPEAEVAAALRACDVLVQPYPDGVTTRRTSVMAGLAAGVATVTTEGRLTERVWRETPAVVLGPASDATAMRDSVIALLSDDARRQRQAANGKRTYDERFAIDRSVDALLGA